MATEANWEDDNEWELINDDGFVYKRKKRRRFDSTSISEQPPPDSAAEEKKNRRERKKRALLKLKESYQREIRQWEHLSNTLNNMKQENPRQINDFVQSTDQITGPPVPLEQSAATNSRKVVDELLSQAEAQAAIIRDVSNLCEVGEALCLAKEESFERILVELPIWAVSPSEMMKALCDSG